MFCSVYKNRRVWLSGHTGFKGAWLAYWLNSLGAKVRGYSLAPEANQPLHRALNLADHLDSRFADIRDPGQVRDSISEFQPDFVFHLAAQPLVRAAYADPAGTIATNVLGTVHVLEAMRRLKSPCVAVIVTSDKCYENAETGRPHEETDPMGGRDPYSASKGMAELAVRSYRSSYFSGDRLVRVASARAGNVIGGGDYAEDRIVPDIVRARSSGRPIMVRNPSATRPWQHVLEPLAGYLWLGACLDRPSLALDSSSLQSGFNFGPDGASVRPVRDLVAGFSSFWPDLRVEHGPAGPHEASRLSLSVQKASKVLGWRPVWNFDQAVGRTAGWYDSSDPSSACGEDLGAYCRDAAELRLPWTT
jgi:CDP-glucose 4,6-dehydratase